MDAETPTTLARRFFAEQDRLRGGPAAELCAPGYAARLPGTPPLDLAGHQAFAAAFYAGFPDLRHVVELAAADGDRVAVRFRLHGTHTGEFLGIAPTGRPIVVSATAILRIVDGQVAELWGEFDRLGLLGQLTGAGVAAEAARSNGI
jgi:predicted ester cyclase